jgi:hypothetical protein
MRTTLNIEDDALSEVKKYAEERGIALGQAASDLIHRGAGSLPRFKTKNGWVIFDAPAVSPQLSNEILEKWENEDNEEEYRRAFSPRH